MPEQPSSLPFLDLGILSAILSLAKEPFSPLEVHAIGRFLVKVAARPEDLESSQSCAGREDPPRS